LLNSPEGAQAAHPNRCITLELPSREEGN
jgi:hypothetical protein